MIALVILALFGGFYGLMYYLNHQVPVPEGAKEKLENCGGCSISSCELHPSHMKVEEVEC